MDNDDIKLLLVKYITNQANETEAREVKHWIGLHPENELYFVELYEAWQNMLYLKPATIDEEKAYGAFSDRIMPKRSRVSFQGWLKIAAAFVVLILSAALFVFRHSGHANNLQVIAKNGSVKKILLTDGTIVWLNAGSSLHYDAGFGKTNRTVYLEGEAFFDIGHPKATHIPFLVNTKKYTIRDIGTKFNLKAYPNDPYFETTVIKGEVAVEANADNANRIYVKPHQVLKIYYAPEKDEPKGLTETPKSYNEVQVSQVDSAKTNIYDGWKDDLLIFDGNTLDEIARVLERRYDVKIAIEGHELEKIRYSGSFKSVRDIDEVLHIIKQNTPINYTIEGQKITITQTN